MNRRAVLQGIWRQIAGLQLHTGLCYGDVVNRLVNRFTKSITVKRAGVRIVKAMLPSV
jgi:hypothetical protein